MKVILDTNIIVSALLSPQGLSAKILNFVLNGKLTIVYDNIIFAEYVEVLNRNKFELDKESPLSLLYTVSLSIVHLSLMQTVRTCP